MAIYQRLRKSKDGTRKKGTWYYDFRHKGQRYVGCIGEVSRTVAKEEAARKKAAVVEQRLNPAKAIKSPRFADFGVKYLEWMQANRKPETCRRLTRTVQHLTEFFKAKKLSEVTSWNIEQYKRARKEAGLAPSSVNLEIAVIKAMFTQAMKWQLLAEHPGKDVKLLPAPQGKTRFLSEEEEAAILAVCSPALSRITQAGLLTGFRRQELTSLRPVDVDLEHEFVSVAACYAKNGESRTLPVSPRLKTILHEALATHGTATLVFTKDTGEAWTPSAFAHAFAGACGRAGLERLHPHVLRHTFASRLVMAGVDIRTVQELMGHKTIEMTLRYAHLSPDHKRSAMDLLEARFSGKSSSHFHNSPVSPSAVSSKKVMALR